MVIINERLNKLVEKLAPPNHPPKISHEFPGLKPTLLGEKPASLCN
jgi:hypothetical protein